MTNQITELKKFCDKLIYEGHFLTIRPQKVKALLKAHEKMRQTLEKINTLSGYHITYDPPAKKGCTLFDIIDAQNETLKEVDQIMKDIK